MSTRAGNYSGAWPAGGQSLNDVELDRAEFQDAAAWVLAAVLTDWEGAVERVRELDQQAEGAARQATDMALARLESRMVVSAVG